jgi:hypothetical protein
VKEGKSGSVLKNMQKGLILMNVFCIMKGIVTLTRQGFFLRLEGCPSHYLSSQSDEKNYESFQELYSLGNFTSRIRTLALFYLIYSRNNEIIK